MKISSFVLPLSLISAVTVGAGCSTSQPNTAADYMRGHATEQQADVNQQNRFADDWEGGNALVSEGSRDVEKGSEKVRKGQESIQEGNEQILQGKNKIEEGRAKMKGAKLGFEGSNPNVDLHQND